MTREDRFTYLRKLGYAGTLGQMLDAYAKDTTRLDEDVDKGSTLYSVRDYGAKGTYDGTTGSNDTSAIFRAIDDLQSSGLGGTIFFPPRPSGQYYRCTSSLPNLSGLRIAGANRRTTRICFVGCDMFTVSSGSLSELIIEGLYISISGGHMFNLTGSGTLTFSVIRDSMLYAQSSDKSLLYQNGSGDVLENWWTNLDMYRIPTHTVPAFDIKNSAGGANANVWQRCRANSGNCIGAPFWRIEATETGTYAYDNSWADIVGEQNPGGLVHLYSNNSPFFRNVYDWDATVDYTDHVIKIDKSATSATESRNVAAINAGRRGGTLGSGIKDFYASANTRGVDLINVGNHTTTPVVQIPSKGASVQTDSGLFLATGDVVQTGRNTTANRPSAATAGAAAMFYDTTLSKPVWSDGTVWRDAAGTSV